MMSPRSSSIDAGGPGPTTLVAGRFAVLEEIGRGGMGVVLRCQDQVLKRIIALKILECRDRPDLIARFHREARAAARLDHPGIVKVLDFGNDGNRLFLCMEVIPGKSLDALLETGSPLPGEKAVPLLLQIARALEHSHKNGVLHRDIKPSNIIVEQTDNGDLRATIVDFGIAKLQTDDLGKSVTLTGAILGTPAYMSPEAARGEKLDNRSDIYSFGCLMYELLTGRRPFQADNNLALMLEHLKSPVPRFPENTETGEAAGLEAITRRCLEKSPGRRYQSFAELREALESLLESLSHAEPDPAEAGITATAIGAPWAGAAAAVLMLLTVVAVTTIIGFDRPDPGENSTPRAPVDPRHRLLTGLSTEAPALSLAGQEGDFYLTGNVRGRHDLNILEGRRDIRVLRIEVADLRIVDREPLIELPLEEICLSASELDEGVLEDIGRIKTLKRLDLQYCSNITADGVAGLAGLENLETLNLQRTAIDDAGLAKIAGLPRLRKLGLKECPYLTGSSWKTLGTFPRLAWLVAFESGLEKGDQKSLILPPGLRRLETSRLSASLVDSLRRSQVEDLMILEDRESTRSDFLRLGELEGLRRIGIFNCPACKSTGDSLPIELKRRLPGCTIVIRDGDRLDLDF